MHLEGRVRGEIFPQLLHSPSWPRQLRLGQARARSQALPACWVQLVTLHGILKACKTELISAAELADNMILNTVTVVWVCELLDCGHLEEVYMTAGFSRRNQGTLGGCGVRKSMRRVAAMTTEMVAQWACG